MKNKLFSSLILFIPFLLLHTYASNENFTKPNAALEIYLYSPVTNEIKGETLNGHFVDIKAIEVLSLRFSTSNNIYFGSQANTPLQAGDASGNTLTFRTEGSTAIPSLYEKLCNGNYFADIIIPIGLSPASPTRNVANFGYREKIELKKVYVTEVRVSSVNSATGDVIYDITIAYGAIKRTMYESDAAGTLTSLSSEWSYVLNNNTFEIE
jgi:type VI protein secretion system component Hcp